MLYPIFFYFSELTPPPKLVNKIAKIFPSLSSKKYHTKAHTTPDKCGASVKGNPPLDNQQVKQVSQ